MTELPSYETDRDFELPTPGPTLGKAPRKAPNETTLKAQQTTTLSPRFYTTNFDELDRLSVEPVRAEWDAMIAEFAADKNLGHFKRNADWAFDPGSLSPALHQEFLDFLVSSLTAEFSGCVLYAEAKKRGLNRDLCTLFKYMARDEARHAGFINDCLQDFKVDVDLGFLVKAKKYTFFSPKFILYATYLSEKIGYARYITIFRHLEANPDKRFHPIFKWFKEWCNDEFRHGEALALMMRANPTLLTGLNRLWIRFFQVAVFATMFVRDHSRPEMHQAMGLDPEQYGLKVFGITSEICKQVFPVLVDVESPRFLELLRELLALSRAIEAARTGGLWGRVKTLALQARTVLVMGQLLLLPTRSNELPQTTLMSPAW
jgi:magnesium-protoporphyrin IX monomethyl ester (oxidative) cyclase